METWHGVALVITAVVTAAVVLWKVKPETAQINITTADKVNEMTLRFAGKVGAENDALVEDLRLLREEFAQYRRDTDSELVALRIQIRGEKAEKQHALAENEQLKRRVATLESEVARLQAAQQG